MNFWGYRCSLCGAEYDVMPLIYTCTVDGGNLDVILEFDRIGKSIRRESIFNSNDLSLWRYLPLLPIPDPGFEKTPLHAAGFTPVFKPPLLKSALKHERLWIKDESRNPTASFKDRASAVVIARAKEIGADVVVTASTGNAGAALAGMAAAVGQKAVIFAPRTAPQAKIAQLLVFGAQVLLVDGNYDEAFDLTIQAAQEFGWYCRNTGYNPFTLEGKKTAAFEIWEWWERQEKAAFSFGDLSVFVSVGDGNIISGIYKGFKDLEALGWIEQIPRIIGIQASGSAAIANAYNHGSEQIIPVKSVTLADSISVDLPRDGIRALRAVKETGGFYLTVSDQEILDAIPILGSVGIFAEPAGAASFAGLIKAIKSQQVSPNEPMFVINTGSGLKDIRAAMQAVKEAPIIEPKLEAVKKIVG